MKHMPDLALLFIRLLAQLLFSILLFLSLSGCDDSGFSLHDINEDPLIPGFVIKDINGKERMDFIPGEPVVLEYRLQNNTNQQVTIDASTLPCVFELTQNGVLVWTSGRSLILILDTIILNPLESLDCSSEWDGKDMDGNPVPAGQYQADVIRDFTLRNFAVREADQQTISLQHYIPVPGGSDASDLITANFRILDQFDQETSNFLLGEEITFRISYTNITYLPITYYYTGYISDCHVYRDGELIWNAWHEILFAAVVSSSTIGPLVTQVTGCRWNGINNQGDLVAPGDYTVVPSLGFSVYDSNGDYIPITPSLGQRSFTIH